MNISETNRNRVDIIEEFINHIMACIFADIVSTVLFRRIKDGEGESIEKLLADLIILIPIQGVPTRQLVRNGLVCHGQLTVVVVTFVTYWEGEEDAATASTTEQQCKPI